MAEKSEREQSIAVNAGEPISRTLLEELAQKAILGDRDAILDLCQKLTRSILFRVICVLHDRMDAEDVTQEILIRVFTGIQKLKEPKAFYVWLNRIIINETSRYLTINSKHGAVLNLDDHIDEKSSEAEDHLPLENAIGKEERAIVMGIVRQLPERQLQAVMMHYYDGLNVTEVADAMGVSKPTISQYLAIARDKIKAGLQQQEGDVSLYGMAAAPIGLLLNQTLQQEAAIFTGANAAWLQNIIGSAATIADSAATSAAGSAGANSGNAAAGGHSVGVIATAGAAAIVSVGILIGAPFMQEQPAPPPVISAEYEISFSGSAAGSDYMNPSRAVARAYSVERGDMTPLHWRITAEGSDVVLYSGDGGVVDDTLIQMTANGENGAYILSFDMADSEGDIWTLSRKFTINMA